MAQTVAGSIEGSVVDAAGRPVPEARVSVTGPALQGIRVTACNESGWFRIDLLPVGSHQVRIGGLGLRQVVLQEVIVSLGGTTDLGEIALDTEAIEIPEVHVVSKRGEIRARATALGGHLATESYRALPSDRDYQSIVTLLPHAGASYYGDRANVAGTSGPETNYFVDGMNVVEPPGNAVSTSLPYNFIEEIEVRAGGYEAEYGGAGGGVISTVTASGGNEFRGQAFGFFANRLFTTTLGGLAVSPKTLDYASWDAGASAGGPVAKDRLWYFLAYGPAFEKENLGLPGQGVHTDSRHAHRFAAKLTARPDDRSSLVIAALGDPGRRDQVGGVVLARTNSLGNLDPMLGEQRGGGWNVSLHATRTFGTRCFAAFGAGFADSRYSLLPRTARGAAEPLFIDARTGYVEGGFGQSVERTAGRSAARAVIAYERRGHSLKAGAAYDDEYFSERFSLDQLWRLDATLYQYVTLADRRSRNHIRAPAAFVQDTWRAANRLSLNLGLRWSEEFWIASGGGLGQRVAGQWQPRAGFTWLIGARKTASVFGSFGRFYQRTRLNVPQFFLQDTPSTYYVRRYDHDPRSDPSGGTIVFAQTLGRQPEVGGLRGAAFDEVQAGAERRLGGEWRIEARGLFRTQRDGVVGVLSPVSLQAVYGNPGEGELKAYPEIERVYRAVEVSVASEIRPERVVGASYTLSSLRGNYEGYWDQTAGQNDPLGGGSFMPEPGAATFSGGPLPGDRLHQLKGFVSRSMGWGLAAGATVLWASGTPLSELGSTPFGAPYYVHLQPRGSLGRTPAIYDLSLRMAYEPPGWTAAPARPRLLADVYHVGNPRKAVVVDQVHYLGVTSGVQHTPNPNYGKPLLFQPAVAYRLGVEVSW